MRSGVWWFRESRYRLLRMYCALMYRMGTDNSRSTILQVDRKFHYGPYPQVIIRSMRKEMGNTRIASAMNIGRRIARRCRSTFTALSTCRSQTLHRTHWRLKVCAKERRIGLETNKDAVKKMSEALAQVKDEQAYIVVRERTHRNTAESTNARVKWWSLFQLGVLIGEGVFQVWWLKRFFEVSICNPFAGCANSSSGKASCIDRNRQSSYLLKLLRSGSAALPPLTNFRIPRRSTRAGGQFQIFICRVRGLK
jgi:hypothetical protein